MCPPIDPELFRNAASVNTRLEMAQPQVDGPRCIFVTGPRGSGKTRIILDRLRKLNASLAAPEGTVAVLLAEEGRIHPETLAAALPGLIMRRLFLPCQCCPELARLPAMLQSVAQSNPSVQKIFIEVPDVAAWRFIEEFDSVIRWPRSLIVSLNAAWAKARRIQMLAPFQNILLESADEIVELDEADIAQRLLQKEALEHSSPTTAPFNLTL